MTRAMLDRVVLDRPSVVHTVALTDSTGAPLTGRLLEFDGGELLFTTLDQPARPGREEFSDYRPQLRPSESTARIT